MEGLPDIKAIIMEAIEAAARPRYSARLGASMIGHACDRRLWLQFHWAHMEHHGGRMLRLFEVGHAAEARIIAELETAGMLVLARDEDTGKQYKFTSCAGHFVAKFDGVVYGVPGAERTYHLLELKTAKASRFRELTRKGIPDQHVAQMQTSMRIAGLTRALYVAENKDDSDLYVQRVRLDKDHADRLIDRADSIISAGAPPEVGYKPSYYLCKMCQFASLCHSDVAPDFNCRTCCYSSPVPGGRWRCKRSTPNMSIDRELSLEDQKQACPEHIFIPPIFGAAESYEYQDGTVLYTMRSGHQWANCGRSSFPSARPAEVGDVVESEMVAGQSVHAATVPF